ncbi:MAG: hydantoinase B/oxoprolinase family protein [Actinomycetia bacterium]|nr:hydantoinase B/oxoprolinase family protein [Actinomycetes bacterium]
MHGPIPQNSGLVRPIHIVAPEGTLVNPAFPAPTISRACPGVECCNTIMRALAHAVPDQVCAGVGNLNVITSSGLRSEDHWVHMEIYEGAYGGRPQRDGMDTIDILFTNTRNNPIEDLESHLPLRVHWYELRDFSCVPGRSRGGIGAVRETEWLEDGGFSIKGQGQRFPTWDFDGGSDGLTNEIILERATGERAPLPSKVPYMPASAGDRTVVIGACGGGYGDPFERDPDRVLADVRDGYLTVEAADRGFGVVITGGRSIDVAATRQRRSATRSGRSAPTAQPLRQPGPLS